MKKGRNRLVFPKWDHINLQDQFSFLILPMHGRLVAHEYSIQDLVVSEEPSSAWHLRTHQEIRQ